MKAIASSIMSNDLVTVKMTDSLSNAYAKMKANKIRHLPVLDCGRIVGIISDRDFQRGIQTPAHSDEPIDFGFGGIVRDYMSTEVVTVPYDAHLISVVQKMINEKISSVVITRDNSAVGIISHEDLLKVLADLLRPLEERLITRVQNWVSQTLIGDVAYTLSQSGI